MNVNYCGVSKTKTSRVPSFHWRVWSGTGGDGVSSTLTGNSKIKTSITPPFSYLVSVSVGY